jgi:hypothetical protein
MSAIPELQQAAEDILKANGVTDNLTGRALEQARQQVINGMIDGAVYSETHNPQQDLGRMTAAQSASYNLEVRKFNESVRQHNNQMKLHGFDEDGNYHPEYLGSLGKTKSGNPVYLDKKGNPFAYGKDGVTKYYDNDGDGVFKDTYPSKKSSSSSTKSEPLLEKMYYNGKGQATQAKSSTGLEYGTRISYADAVEFDHAIKDHHKGFEDNYTYWKGKKGGADVVYVIPKGNTAKPYNYSGEGIYQDVPDDSEDDQNQL